MTVEPTSTKTKTGALCATALVSPSVRDRYHLVQSKGNFNTIPLRAEVLLDRPTTWTSTLIIATVGLYGCLELFDDDGFLVSEFPEALAAGADRSPICWLCQSGYLNGVKCGRHLPVFYVLTRKYIQSLAYEALALFFWELQEDV